MNLKRAAAIAAAAILLTLYAHGVIRGQQSQQQISNFDRDRAEEMLRVVHEEIKRHYYDATFHGVDLDSIVKTYEERIKDARRLGAAFADVAAYAEKLNDSHTFFIPPLRSFRFDYGLRFQLIGNRAFVTEVRAGSDAAQKIHVGDEILSIGPYTVNRQDFHDINYVLYQLAPQPGLALDLRDPSGGERKENVKTKIEPGKRVMDLTASGGGIDIFEVIRRQESEEHLLRQRSTEIDDVLFWKMPEFFMTDSDVDGMIGRARKHKALVLDLRGNPGGSVMTLERVIGDVIDHDVTIATRVSRKPEKPEFAKTRGKNSFDGKLVVLIDSRSASAAELFARIVQLEHRGVVVGDQSAGAVMEARYFPEHLGIDTEVFYGVSITNASLIMSDGKSLEGVGVTPDVVVLPTAADLAAGRDPALAKAAELAGVKLDPEAAGKLFPFEWAPLSAE